MSNRLTEARQLRASVTRAADDLLQFLAKYKGHFTTRLDKRGEDRARALFTSLETFRNTQLDELIQRWTEADIAEKGKVDG